MFRPKLLDTLKTYTAKQFTADASAGVIVGIVALPLAIAFAIASGVSPVSGLYTAIIAGFLISALGGSRVQIGGPTGAFIVVVYSIVQQYGINGLLIATFIAGVMLIIMGLARLGSVIKFIPLPLITGFTSAIAVVIFSSQVKDFFGLEMGEVPADFVEKWVAFSKHISTINWFSFGIAALTVIIVVSWQKIYSKIPGSLVAILVTAALANLLDLPVETIGSRFGEISFSFPEPSLPEFDFTTFKNLLKPAFTIALLGAIESLLSAVVADGMIGGNHRSNTELVAQGTANIFSSLFGGIPATGAIARTATNIKNGGSTPVAGIIHALTLLIILLFAGQWAAMIPMATLAGILAVVAFNMSEWRSFVSLLKGPGGDVLVLLVTFFLTLLADLTIAIEVGMVLACFLFMRNMIRMSAVSSNIIEVAGEDSVHSSAGNTIPADVLVFEITGPLFFGAVYKFKDAIRLISKRPRVMIIRMRNVPIIDATGIKALKDIHKDSVKRGTRIILSGITSSQVKTALEDAGITDDIGKENIVSNFREALERSKTK